MSTHQIETLLVINYYYFILYRTNANIDLIISGVELLRELGVAEIGIGKYCSEVSSLHILEECFSYFMERGAAAERTISTQDLNSIIVTATSRLSYSQVKYCNYLLHLILETVFMSPVFRDS